MIQNYFRSAMLVHGMPVFIYVRWEIKGEGAEKMWTSIGLKKKKKMGKGMYVTQQQKNLQSRLVSFPEIHCIFRFSKRP